MLGGIGRFERVEYGVKKRWEGLWMLGEIGSFQRVGLGMEGRWQELLHCWDLEFGIEL